jgi:hypothetical protein
MTDRSLAAPPRYQAREELPPLDQVSGPAPRSYLLSDEIRLAAQKLDGVAAQTGRQSVLIGCHLGTTAEQVGGLAGFTPSTPEGTLLPRERCIVFHGVLNTNQDNLVQTAVRPFVRFIEAAPPTR